MNGRLTPQHLLSGYAGGIFPMAEGRDCTSVFWLDPRLRGILPLDGFRISRSLARRIRKAPFRITIDTAFNAVVAGCAARPETWINDEIARLYLALYKAGYAHALEVWDGADLIGGVYGVALGGAFFGESMFSRRTDASKVALAYLVHRLRVGGFCLFDTQFVTCHLKSLGAVEISRAHYRHLLGQALARDASFDRAPAHPHWSEVIRHPSTHTS